MNTISTHILDVSLGKPAAGVEALLEVKSGKNWSAVGHGRTNDDGRIANFNEKYELKTGIYRLTFETNEYFASQNAENFYPIVQITFEVKHADQHYHVPLLLSPFGYSTYRGS